MTAHILFTADELAKAITNGKTIIVDTRHPDSYLQGHIPGAVNMREIFTYLPTTDAEGLALLKDTFSNLFLKAGVCRESTGIFYEESMHTGFGQSCVGIFF